jgi:3-phenylpropionate/cinnamic acid dioxygenase small subunit
LPECFNLSPTKKTEKMSPLRKPCKYFVHQAKNALIRGKNYRISGALLLAIDQLRATSRVIGNPPFTMREAVSLDPARYNWLCFEVQLKHTGESWAK